MKRLRTFTSVASVGLVTATLVATTAERHTQIAPVAALPDLPAEISKWVAAVGEVPGIQDLTDDSIIAFALPDDEMESTLHEGDSVQPSLLPDADVTAAGSSVRILADPATLPAEVVGETGLVNFRILVQDPLSPRYSFTEFSSRIVQGPTGDQTWADPLQENVIEPIDGIVNTTGELLDSALGPIIEQLNQTVAALNPVGLLSVLDPKPVQIDIPVANSAGVICAAAGCAPSAGSTEGDQVWVAPPTSGAESSEIAAPFKTVAYNMTDDESAHDDGTGFVEAPRQTFYRGTSCPQGGLGDVYGTTKSWRVTIGTAYPASASDSAFMTFNSGSTAEFVASFGGAYTDFVGGIGWKRSSGRTIEKGSGFDWAPKNYNRSFQITSTYQKISHYYDRCPGETPYSANWRAKQINTGGYGEVKGITPPDWGNCETVSSDGTWWRNTKGGRNYYNSGGVKAVGDIGIDLSISRSYTAEARLGYKVKATKEMCGNNPPNEPTNAAGKIMQKKPIY